MPLLNVGEGFFFFYKLCNFAFSAIDHYIDRCRLAVYALHFKAKAQQSNLSIAEKEILTQLSNRRDIVIKPAKKGGAVVLESRLLYIAETNRKLFDGRFYERTNAKIDRDR